MPNYFIAPALLFILLTTSCTSNPVSLSQSEKSEIERFTFLPEETPGLIYNGYVYSLKESSSEPNYRYQRTVLGKGYKDIFSHITYSLDGEVVLAQIAETDQDYKLRHFKSIDRLSGINATMRYIHDNKLEFAVHKGELTKITHENPSLPLVAGPTLFGFILKNWDDLKSGLTIPFAFVLIERGETMRFEAKYGESNNEFDTIIIQTKNPFIRLLVAPMKIVFAKDTRQPIRYIGRVPVMLQKNDSLTAFDARVEYHYPSSQAYR